MRRTSLLVSFACASTFLLLPAAASAQIAFSDQTAPAGLTHSHALDLAHFGNPMLAGGAVGDFNRDGWPDLFVLGGGGGPDRLFVNQGDGSFLDQAAAHGVDRVHHGCGAAAGDYDGDGWIDLFVTSYGPAGQAPQPGGHLLYHNEGNGSFSERAAAAGVNYASLSIPDGYGAAFGDYDRDGDLDLYVTGWEWYSDGNVLFQNQGNGTFQDVTAAAGLTEPLVHGFVPTFADMDQDGWMDLLLFADTGTSRYFKNDGNGAFSRVGGLARFASLNGMGTAVGDFDNDLDLDFYGTSVYWGPGSGNALYWNQGGHAYTETAAASGVDDGAWGWGTVAFDCDNDGWLDIAETNGFGGVQFENQPKRLFMNDHDTTFTESAAAAGITTTEQGRGLIRWDYDRDGDEDLVFLANQGPLRLYRNDGAGGRWLRLRFDTSANPDLAPYGVGTRALARSGERTSMRYLEGGQSYLSQSEQALHFGLADKPAVDVLRVIWADGSESYLADVAAGQELTLDAGLPITVPAEIHKGARFTVTVGNAQAGEKVLFLASEGRPGPGPCSSELGGLCLDLTGTPRSLGAAHADATGTASLAVAIPRKAPLESVSFQAVIRRGPGGADSVKTGAVARPVLP